ncbi:MAG TPA: MFS transporter [Planctomycetaceae bacterium]|jgi:MFS family permease|nr:MFS transporter [Planctomycetaceae bacterium]
MNNNRPLFFASFMTLIAAGLGFALRGAILSDWESQFGFTKQVLGTITGGGLVGGGVTIILFSTVTDRLGYKTILMMAFVLHVLSAVVTLAATPVYAAFGQTATLNCLYWGMFMFSSANGLCETAINPLVATLYPRQKTHYLNILHAGWPGGMVVGGALAYFFCGQNAAWTHLRWEILMGLFLIPTAIYGFIILFEKFPLSEARAAGVGFSTMLLEFASPIFLMLVVLMAMVGYVELGTDSWITNIMNNVIKGKAFILFVYMQILMFVLRFFAGPIVEKINPIGLLFCGACLAAIGLASLSYAAAAALVFVAGTTYALGKTFFWPTMLGVVGERFPKGGALTMGTLGSIGMLSAGLLGGPGIGYQQDYFASQELREKSPEIYKQYVAPEKSHFLFFEPISGLDGKKVSDLIDQAEKIEKGEKAEPLTEQQALDVKPVEEARLYGGRMALRYTSIIPVIMACGYLLLIGYFRAKGGYKVEILHGKPMDGEEFTGGVEAALET